MGCVSSRDDDAVRRTMAIDQQLASQSAARRNEIKLLLLGKIDCVMMCCVWFKNGGVCKYAVPIPREV